MKNKTDLYDYQLASNIKAQSFQTESSPVYFGSEKNDFF